MWLTVWRENLIFARSCTSARLEEFDLIFSKVFFVSIFSHLFSDRCLLFVPHFQFQPFDENKVLQRHSATTVIVWQVLPRHKESCNTLPYSWATTVIVNDTIEATSYRDRLLKSVLKDAHTISIGICNWKTHLSKNGIIECLSPLGNHVRGFVIARPPTLQFKRQSKTI